MGLIDINKIPRKARGILYINEYNYELETLTPIKYLLFADPMHTLDAYANTPNPESTMASGSTYEEFIQELRRLHQQMNDPAWVRELKEYL